MTRTEIEAAVLQLTDTELAALAETLLSSLPEQNQADLYRAHISGVRDRFESEVAEGFASGSGRTWEDSDWNRLLDGTYRHQAREESWAAPPGWRSPRLGPKNPE